MPSTAEQKRKRGETRPSRLATSPASGLEPPVKPGDLTPAASVIWDRILAATADTRHIGPAHADTFKRYCEVTAALDAANPKGTKEWRELVVTFQGLAKQLLLTPATSGALAKHEPKVDPLAKFLAN